MTRARLWRELRPFVGPAAIAVLYLVVGSVFGAVTGSHGVLTPSGSVDRTLAVLAFATFVLRLCALVLVPGVIAYRIVLRLLAPAIQRSAARAIRRSDSGPA